MAYFIIVACESEHDRRLLFHSYDAKLHVWLENMLKYARSIFGYSMQGSKYAVLYSY